MDQFKREIEKRLKRLGGKPETVVVVGYSQKYALVVHERTDLKHAPGKMAKYLEGPARRYRREIQGIIRRGYKDGDKPDAVMLRAGWFLQRVSQEVVPIDTSALKASAFTALEEEADGKAAEAYSQSEALRLSRLNARSKTRLRQSVARREKKLVSQRLAKTKRWEAREARRLERIQRSQARVGGRISGRRRLG